MVSPHSIYFCCAISRADSHRDSLAWNSVCCSFLSFLRCRAQPCHSLLCPLVCRIPQLSLNTSFGMVCGAPIHTWVLSGYHLASVKWHHTCYITLQCVCLCLAGEECYATSPDGVHGPPCHRHFPDRRGYVEGAEGAKGSPHGGHPHRSVCALLVPFLRHRAHQSPVFLGRPCHLEEHLPVVGLF